MKLSAELAAILAAGGTLLVPNAQRAAAVRLAYARGEVAQGRQVWATPDVVTPEVVLQRAAEARGAPLLNPLGEWLLLRQIVSELHRGAPTTPIDSWVDSLALSLRRLRDFAIPLSAVRGFANPEAEWFVRVGTELVRRTQALGLHAPSLASVELAAPLHAAGFVALPQAWRKLDIRPIESGAAAGNVEVFQALDPESEIALALQYAERHLREHPSSRLLLVVPNDDAYRPSLQRAVRQSFAVNDESVQRLGEFAVPRRRLQLLRFLYTRLTTAELTAWLQQVGGAADLTKILLSQARATWSLSELLGVAPTALQTRLQALAALSDSAEAELGQWLRRLEQIAALAPDWWGASNLQNSDWAVAWADLIDSLAQAAPAVGRLDAAQWIALLAARIERETFRAAPRDRGLTLADSDADPIVSYDRLWVCGRSSERWPAPARPDPWIPRALQRSAGIPGSHDALTLAEARAAAAALRSRTTQCVFSWPRAVGDQPLSPSSLLMTPLVAATDEDAAPPRVEWVGWSQRMHAAASELQRFSDERFTHAAPVPLPLGANALDLQLECPFRAAAETRLGASAPKAMSLGIDAMLRGTLLHKALELFWKELRTSAKLAQLSTLELQRRCEAVVSEVIEAQTSQTGDSITRRAALDREAPRLVRLLLESVALDRDRAPFVVEKIEHKLRFARAGLQLDLKIDRLDSTASGNWLIDYKSGRSDKSDWLGTRPRRVQLWTYREALNDAEIEIVLLAKVHLGAKETKVLGAAQNPGHWPALKSALPKGVSWENAAAEFSRVVSDALQRLALGDAALDPQKEACDFCHLPVLCRRNMRLGSSSGDDDHDGDDADE